MNELYWNLFYTTLIFDAMLNIVVILGLLNFKWNQMKYPVLAVGLPVGVIIYCIKLLELPNEAIFLTTLFGTMLGLLYIIKKRTWHLFVAVFIGVVLNILFELLAIIVMMFGFGSTAEILQKPSLDLVLISIPLFSLKLIAIYVVLKYRLSIYRKER